MHTLIPGALILVGNLLLRFLSIIVPYLRIELKTGKRTTRMVKAILFVVGGVAYVFVHLALLGSFNFGATIKKIVFGNYTYQDMRFLPVLNILMEIVFLNRISD